MKPGHFFVALLVLAWLVWDTGADPVRLTRGLPWIVDFVRRMMPPDLSVLPAALVGALKTVEIALLGTAVAAVLALPLGFLSARNVTPGAVFYPARAVLNFLRSVDTLVYALIFVAAVGLGPFPGVLADEPTASLDPALTTDIMGILKSINARGLTLVVSQHQLETALAYATRIVGLRRGRVIFDGPPASVTPAVIDAIYGEAR